MRDRTDLNPSSLKPISDRVSHGVAASGQRTLYISGQVATDHQGQVVGKGDVAAQAHQVMKSLQAILREGGAEFRDVVKVNMYLRDMKDLPAVIKVRSEYITESRPAATAVGVAGLANPDYLLEIEVVAVVG